MTSEKAKFCDCLFLAVMVNISSRNTYQTLGKEEKERERESEKGRIEGWTGSDIKGGVRERDSVRERERTDRERKRGGR